MRLARIVAVLAIIGGAATLHGQEDQKIETLDGTWEVVSLIDDGELIPARVVQERFFKDGRIMVQGQLIQFTAPDGKTRLKTFAINPQTSPKSFDLSTGEKVGTKGIYVSDGDTLVICLAGAEGHARPTTFASRQGQDNVLFSLQRVRTAEAPSAAVKPPAPAQPTGSPPQSDEDLRKALIGTWGHQDDKTVQRITLNADGTFGTELQYTRGFKKLFDQDERASGR